MLYSLYVCMVITTRLYKRLYDDIDVCMVITTRLYAVTDPT